MENCGESPGQRQQNDINLNPENKNEFSASSFFTRKVNRLSKESNELEEKGDEVLCNDKAVEEKKSFEIDNRLTNIGKILNEFLSSKLISIDEKRGKALEILNCFIGPKGTDQLKNQIIENVEKNFISLVEKNFTALVEENISKPNNEAEADMLYTYLNKNDNSLKYDENKFNEILNSKDFRDEKLRKMIFVLNSFISEHHYNISESAEKQLPIKKCIDEFFQVIDKYYIKLIEAFEESKSSYKPFIKLLQIFEVFLENINESPMMKKDSVQRMSNFIETKINISDWRSIRKILEEGKNINVKIKNDNMVHDFIMHIQSFKKVIIWQKESESVKKASEIIDYLIQLYENKPETLRECLKKGRFDKRELNIKNTFIIGDEGGIFLLLNSIKPDSQEKKIIFEAGVSQEYLKDKIDQSYKVLLGKGGFGKVRLALSILGNLNFDAGQLVCIKKSSIIASKPKLTIKLVVNSILEDYFSSKLNSTIHHPRPIDMALMTNHPMPLFRKGYFIMEVFPDHTADLVFNQDKYKKWEYLKPYIIMVMNTMNDLLLKEKIFFTDLKPPNTLFDPLSRKLAIIDFGSSILVKDVLQIECFKGISDLEFAITKTNCPPEIINNNEQVNLKKSLSYLCGMTIARVTSKIPGSSSAANTWELGKNTDLVGKDRENFEKILKQLIEQKPENRIDLNKAIEAIKSIGTNYDEIIKKASQEQYVMKMRDLANKDPSALNLNADINEIRRKGIIEQRVVEKNPAQIKDQPSVNLNEALNNFFNDNSTRKVNDLFVLLGEAGCGKSLALQLNFLNELFNWEYGKKALPVYFNMAEEMSLENVFSHINEKVGCNLNMNEASEEIHLFVDSYDEGAGDRIMKELNYSKILSISLSNQLPSCDNNFIHSYFNKLKNWKRVKILLTCRTDFLNNLKNKDEFTKNLYRSTDDKFESILKYISPIGYEKDLNQKENNFKLLVREWLQRENKYDDINPDSILKKINSMGLRDRMQTGLMFNMIMSMMLKNDDKIDGLPQQRIRGFEIYKRTIREEFDKNWKHIISNQGGKAKARIQLLKEEVIDSLFKKSHQQFINHPAIGDSFDKDIIWEGVNLIGERIAVEMTHCKKNRLKLSEVKSFVYKTPKKESDNPMRIERETIYQIFRILGLKTERRKISNANNQSEYLEVGFRHETYKNYFLLIGLKRVLALRYQKNEEKGGDDRDEMERRLDDKLLTTLLDDDDTIRNTELLRFFGEEMKYRDNNLKQNLRQILKEEQLIQRNKKRKDINSPINQPNITERRAAVTISLLVAGDYSFSGQDLSDLDLSGAIMRGGMFFSTNFARTNLSNATLGSAELSDAKFDKTRVDKSAWGWQNLIFHDSYVNSVCFSFDGKNIASGGNDSSIKIWNSEEENKVKTLVGHSNEVYSVCFSKDGKQLISGSEDKTVKIWDWQKGECLHSLSANEAIMSVSCALFSGVEKLAGGLAYGSIIIWNLENGYYKLENEYNHCRIAVNSVSFSESGTILVSGASDRLVNVWKVEERSLKLIQTLKGHRSHVTCVCSTLNEKKIASSSGDKTIKIWDRDTGACILTFKGHKNYVQSICFSQDGKKLASGSEDKTVMIWDCETGECVKVLEAHSERVGSVCFSCDGNLVSGSRDGTVKLWGDILEECLQVHEGHKAYVEDICFSEKGDYLVSGGIDKTVKLWETNFGECLQTFEGHTDSITCVSMYLQENLVASGSEDKTVKIWNCLSRDCLNTLAGHSNSISSICFSLDGNNLFSGSFDGTLIMWNTKSGAIMKKLVEKSPTFLFKFSPDKKVLACVNSYKITLFDTENDGLQSISKKFYQSAKTISFSPDGQCLAISGNDKYVNIWYFVSNNFQTLKGHQDYINCVCFDYDGIRIASGSQDKVVKIWNRAENVCLFTIEGNLDIVKCLSFSPNENILAIGSSSIAFWFKADILWDKNNETYLHFIFDSLNQPCCNWNGNIHATTGPENCLSIWDIEKRKCLLTLKGHEMKVNKLAFCYDSDILASSSLDNRIKLWNIKNGTCIETFLIKDEGIIKRLCFSSSGKTLASSTSHMVHVCRNLDGYWSLIKEFYIKGNDNGVVINFCSSSEGKRYVYICKNKENVIRVRSNINRFYELNLEGHKNKVLTVSFSPDGMKIASGSEDSTLKIWDLTSGKCLITKSHDEPVKTLCFSPKGSLIASACNKIVCIWDSKYDLILTLKIQRVISLCFNYFDTIIACCTLEGNLILYDINTVCEFIPEHKEWKQLDQLKIACFNPSSDLLVAGSAKNGNIWICSVLFLKFDKDFKAHDESVEAVCFSLDGSRLASGSLDKTIKIWDAYSWNLLNTLKGYSEKINRLLFCNDHVRLLISSDKEIKIWVFKNDKNEVESLIEQMEVINLSFKNEDTLSVDLIPESDLTEVGPDSIEYWALRMNLRSSESPLKCFKSLLEECKTNEHGSAFLSHSNKFSHNPSRSVDEDLKLPVNKTYSCLEESFRVVDGASASLGQDEKFGSHNPINEDLRIHKNKSKINLYEARENKTEILEKNSCEAINKMEDFVFKSLGSKSMEGFLKEEGFLIFNPRNYIELVNLGKGCFGNVWRAFQKSDREILAIKAMVKKDPLSKNLGQEHYASIAQFIVEKTIMKSFENDTTNYIAKYRGAFYSLNTSGDVDQIFIVSTSGNCNLMDILNHRKTESPVRPYDGPSAWLIFRQLIKGLKILQVNRIYHSDIKPRNIIINIKTNSYEFIDFGISKKIPPCDRNYVFMNNFISGGTLKYFSPKKKNFWLNQRNSNNMKFNPFKDDVWALGVCLYEVFNGTSREDSDTITAMQDILIKMSELDETRRFDCLELNDYIEEHFAYLDSKNLKISQDELEIVQAVENKYNMTARLSDLNNKLVDAVLIQERIILLKSHLDLLFKTKGSQKDVASIFHKLSWAHYENSDMTNASAYLNKALDIWYDIYQTEILDENNISSLEANNENILEASKLKILATSKVNILEYKVESQEAVNDVFNRHRELLCILERIFTGDHYKGHRGKILKLLGEFGSANDFVKRIEFYKNVLNMMQELQDDQFSRDITDVMNQIGYFKH